MNCRRCNKTFTLKDGGRTRLYCSDECRVKWARENRRRYKKICVDCNKMLDTPNKETLRCRSCAAIRRAKGYIKDKKQEGIVETPFKSKSGDINPMYLTRGRKMYAGYGRL